MNSYQEICQLLRKYAVTPSLIPHFQTLKKNPPKDNSNRKDFAKAVNSHRISLTKLNRPSRLMQLCEKSGKHGICWQFKKEMGQVFSE